MSSIVALLVVGTVISTTLKVGILVVGVKTYRANRQSSDPTALEQDGSRTLINRLADWQTHRHRSSPITEAQHLQVWLQKTLPVDDELRTWVTVLTTPELKALAQDLHKFCANWQIDLNWLFDPPSTPFAEFQFHLGELVLAYLRSRWVAQQIQGTNPTAAKPGIQVTVN